MLNPDPDLMPPVGSFFSSDKSSFDCQRSIPEEPLIDRMIWGLSESSDDSGGLNPEDLESCFSNLERLPLFEGPGRSTLHGREFQRGSAFLSEDHP